MLKRMAALSQESPLLQYVTQNLSPAIFSHPVWVRFGNQNRNIKPEDIGELLGEAEKLRRQAPSDACQLLLLCAVCQNYSGQKTRALAIIQNVVDLAEGTGLIKELLWAKWGACAVRAQQGNIEKAAKYLSDIKGLLGQQNEWMLIDFIDIVRQALLHPSSQEIASASRSLAISATDELTTRAIELLDHWGLTSILLRQAMGTHSTLPGTKIVQGLNHLQNRWRSLILMFKGELKLSWVERTSTTDTGQSSFLRSIAGYLHFNILHRDVEAQFFDSPLAPTSIEVKPATDPSLEVQGSPNCERPELNPSERTQPVILSVSVHMLGVFSILIQGTTLKFPPSRSLSLLKYLILNHKQTIAREILMDVFWPDAEPENARNNLNVAMHRIRQILRPATDQPMIHYQNGLYGIAPTVQLWLDVEEFECLANTGERLESRNQLLDAVSNYEAASNLYQGNFLEENSYESWTVLPREHFRMMYLNTLDHLSQIYYNQGRYAMCISLCQRILTQDNCREDAHCMLMRCYNQLGQNHLALRQYQACMDALRLELNVSPAPDTTRLFDKIRQHRSI